MKDQTLKAFSSDAGASRHNPNVQIPDSCKQANKPKNSSRKNIQNYKAFSKYRIFKIIKRHLKNCWTIHMHFSGLPFWVYSLSPISGMLVNRAVSSAAQKWMLSVLIGLLISTLKKRYKATYHCHCLLQMEHCS